MQSYRGTVPGRQARPITTYAKISPANYFAECFAAHEHYPEAFKNYDREGYRLVKRALKYAGVSHG